MMTLSKSQSKSNATDMEVISSVTPSGESVLSTLGINAAKLKRERNNPHHV